LSLHISQTLQFLAEKNKQYFLMQSVGVDCFEFS
jgi:hypothetical protein